MLGHALGHAGDFGRPFEYLHRGNLKRWFKRFDVVSVSELFLELHRVRSSPNGLFGIKAHWPQFKNFKFSPESQILDGIEKVVWIYRQNLLSQAISFEIAQQTGQWISLVPKRKDAIFDYDAIIKKAETIRLGNAKWSNYFASNPTIDVLKVQYETLVATPNIELGKIARHLLPDGNMVPKLSNNTESQSGTINRDWREQFEREIKDTHFWIYDPQS